MNRVYCTRTVMTDNYFILAGDVWARVSRCGEIFNLTCRRITRLQVGCVHVYLERYLYLRKVLRLSDWVWRWAGAWCSELKKRRWTREQINLPLSRVSAHISKWYRNDLSCFQFIRTISCFHFPKPKEYNGRDGSSMNWYSDVTACIVGIFDSE